MTDLNKSELRRLAEACRAESCADEGEEARRLLELHGEIEPEDILSLLDENDKLQADNSSMRGSLKAYAENMKKQIRESGRMQRERDQIRAEVEALRKDAGRYRWLRERSFGFSHDEAGRGISTMRWGEWHYDTPEGHAAQMDMAIDAAMAKEGSANG